MNIQNFRISNFGIKDGRVISKTDDQDTPRNLILRQVFAARSVEAHCQRKVILRYGECTFSDNTSKTYSWIFPGSTRTRCYKTTFSRLHLFMLVGSDGSLIWNFATGANGAATFSLFLANLKDKLDEGRPGWRKNHLIQLDGAGSHTAK